MLKLQFYVFIFIIIIMVYCIILSMINYAIYLSSLQEGSSLSFFCSNCNSSFFVVVVYYGIILLVVSISSVGFRQRETWLGFF